jgi:CheY-like chemotaxis protein
MEYTRKLQYTAQVHGWTRFISMQNQYSLMQREEEREMFGFLAGARVAAGRVPAVLRPQQDSNLRTRLRRPLLYPLSYGGSDAARRREVAGPEPGYQSRTSEDTRPIGGHQGAGDDSLARVTRGLGRVMVVDDDEVIRQLIAVNLTLEGFDVVTAVDGKDCLEKVVEAKPDVITLDVMMPRLDGWVTATQLRRNPQTAGIKVVLITARAQEDDRSRGRQIGVDAYLTKPFDPAEMIRVVRELAGAPTSVFD